MENSLVSLKYLKDRTALGMLILSLSRRESSLKLKQKLCFINRNFKTFAAVVYNNFESENLLTETSIK